MAQKGKDLLIKIGDGVTPTEGFATIGGIRSASLSLNRETVDITNDDSTDRWRELLAGAGVRSISISGSGIAKMGQPIKDVLADYMDDEEFTNYQVIVPGLGTFEGPFELTQLDFSGEHNGAVQWSTSMESAGPVTFTPAA